MTNQTTDEAAVEKIARAMCECVGSREADDEHGGPHPVGHWLDKGEPWWAGYKDLAQVAIDSLENDRANEIETLRAQLTAANKHAESLWTALQTTAEAAASSATKAEQAERMLAERDAELARRDRNEERNCVNWGPCSRHDGRMSDPDVYRSAASGEQG